MRVHKKHIYFPPPALSGSGLMGMISARVIKAPLRLGCEVICFLNPSITF